MMGSMTRVSLLFVAGSVAWWSSYESREVLAAEAEAGRPLQVYILAGQSNMQGHAKISTLGYMAEDPAIQERHRGRPSRRAMLAGREASTDRCHQRLHTAYGRLRGVDISQPRTDGHGNLATTASPRSRADREEPIGKGTADQGHRLAAAEALSAHGVVMATVPATVEHAAPTIAWLAHVDTSPETSGTGVSPVVHASYAGGDLTLPGDPTKVLRVAENPELEQFIGGTIITSDGTTLLGADDKSGVAVIMTAAERLVTQKEVPHGPIRLVFTCDEEVGRGTENLDVPSIGAVVGYTLDGFGKGVINAETFSADLAVVRVTGINTHPSVGKDALVNAIKILAAFLEALPNETLSPETTEGHEGFVHPYAITGGVASAEARILIRDFDEAGLAANAALLEATAEPLRAAHAEPFDRRAQPALAAGVDIA